MEFFVFSHIASYQSGIARPRFLLFDIWVLISLSPKYQKEEKAAIASNARLCSLL